MNIKIIVFDFDLTLTNIHTNGIPNISQNYFSDIEKIRQQLELLKQNNILYINTRGLEAKVKEYLKYYQLDHFFTDIYGAENIEQMNSLNTLQWTNLKLQVLDKICLKETCDKSQILFFDDTEENINIAIENNYINSFCNTFKDEQLLKQVNKIILLGLVDSLPSGDYSLNYKTKLDGFKEMIVNNGIFKPTFYYTLQNNKTKFTFNIFKQHLITLKYMSDNKNITKNNVIWDINKNDIPYKLKNIYGASRQGDIFFINYDYYLLSIYYNKSFIPSFVIIDDNISYISSQNNNILSVSPNYKKFFDLQKDLQQKATNDAFEQLDKVYNDDLTKILHAGINPYRRPNQILQPQQPQQPALIRTPITPDHNSQIQPPITTGYKGGKVIKYYQLFK